MMYCFVHSESRSFKTMLLYLQLHAKVLSIHLSDDTNYNME